MGRVYLEYIDQDDVEMKSEDKDLKADEKEDSEEQEKTEVKSKKR